MEGNRFPEPGTIDLDRLLPAVRRQLIPAGAVCFAALLTGMLWILTAVPLFDASAFVLVDNTRIRAVEDAYGVTPNGDAAASAVDSQIEVIKSDNVTIAAIKSLNLLHDPELIPSPGLFSRLSQALAGLLPGTGSATYPVSAVTRKDLEQAGLHYAADALRTNMDVRRLPRTVIVQISYTSRDPSKAARIANGVAEAYLAEQLAAKYQATKRATDWLEGIIADIKQKAVSTDQAIQKYKEDNGLITSGGRLVNEQQLNEINTQLVQAQAETARAEAKYRRIASIIDGHQTAAIVSEAIGNSIIAQLRTKYLDVSKREAEISVRFGKDHQQALNLRSEMREYERLMFEELSRLAESYRSEVEIARSKEDSLAASLHKSVGLNAGENKVLVGLHELQREAETYRRLYQTYSQRYQEALQQQSFPIVDARIITSASVPFAPSHPKKTAILLLFFVLGLLAGSGVGIYREYQDRGFRSEEQIRDDLGLECLGIIPLIPPESGFTRVLGAIARMWHSAIIKKSPILAQDKPEAPGIQTYAIDNPSSGFSEALLSVKLAADVLLQAKASKIIGVVSSLPGEGKSIISKNLAATLAKLGTKTLLIDCDLRARTLTHWIAPDADAGLVEAVLNNRQLADIATQESASGLTFLPTAMHSKRFHTSEFLASAAMTKFLSQATLHFDYIVVDLPPIGPVVDARAIAPYIGAFVLVIEWRRAPRRMVRNIVTNETKIFEKCLGVVMNKVNMKELKKFESFSSKYFYYSEYGESYYGDIPVLKGKNKPVPHFALAANAEEANPSPINADGHA